MQKQALGRIWSIGSNLQISDVEENGVFLGRYLSMITLKVDKSEWFFIFSTWMFYLPSYYPGWVNWLILQTLFVSLLYCFFFFLLLAFFVFIFFWPCYVTYGIFTLQGIEPKPSRVRTRSPDHETAREVPVSFPFSILFSYCLDSLFEAFKTRLEKIFQSLLGTIISIINYC